MPAPRHPDRWRVAGVVALGLVLLLVGAAVGRLTAPSPDAGGGSAAGPTAPAPTATVQTAPPSPTPTAPPTGPPTAPPTAPSSSQDSPDVTATAEGAPGQDVLAASGTGPRELTFLARRPAWRLETTSRCDGADTFVLTLLRDGQVVTRVQDTAGAADITVQDAGDYRLQVTGDCSWTVRATS